MVDITPILHIIAIFFLSFYLGLLIRLFCSNLRERWILLINAGVLFFYSFLFPMVFYMYYFYFPISFASAYLGLLIGRGIHTLISREEWRLKGR